MASHLLSVVYYNNEGVCTDQLWSVHTPSLLYVQTNYGLYIHLHYYNIPQIVDVMPLNPGLIVWKHSTGFERLPLVTLCVCAWGLVISFVCLSLAVLSLARDHHLEDSGIREIPWHSFSLKCLVVSMNCASREFQPATPINHTQWQCHDIVPLFICACSNYWPPFH